MKPHKALATIEEFRAASKLPLNEKIKWWNDKVKASKLK
jgi:hypothetical protein